MKVSRLFKRTPFSWWEIGLVKWASAFIGIAIGATWPSAFASLSLTFLLVGLIISAYLGFVWARR